jgi:hypothetical protein
VREMIVPGMKVPATEFGLSPFANGGAFGNGGASSFSGLQAYLVERSGMSFSTNNSRNRKSRGRFITSFPAALREAFRAGRGLPTEFCIFMRIHFSTARATVQECEP